MVGCEEEAFVGFSVCGNTDVLKLLFVLSNIHLVNTSTIMAMAVLSTVVYRF